MRFRHLCWIGRFYLCRLSHGDFQYLIFGWSFYTWCVIEVTNIFTNLVIYFTCVCIQNFNAKLRCSDCSKKLTYKSLIRIIITLAFSAWNDIIFFNL